MKRAYVRFIDLEDVVLGTVVNEIMRGIREPPI
jgi:hypothetical protein